MLPRSVLRLTFTPSTSLALTPPSPPPSPISSSFLLPLTFPVLAVKYHCRAIPLSSHLYFTAIMIVITGEVKDPIIVLDVISAHTVLHKCAALTVLM